MNQTGFFRVVRLTLSFIFLINIFTPVVFADGMVIRPDPYSDRWDYGEENSQQAYINYEDGVQKMLISIGMNEDPYKDSVWIFPVPANPEKVTIDVVTQLPKLQGEDISQLAKKTLSNVKKGLLSTQIFPIPFLLLPSFSGNLTGAVRSDVMYNAGSKLEEAPQDVVVYETITKEGLTTELLTAKTSTGLYDYLTKKGLKVDVDSIPAFSSYIGGEYSFVVSWISAYYNPNYWYYNNGYDRSPTTYPDTFNSTTESLYSTTDEVLPDSGVSAQQEMMILPIEPPYNPPTMPPYKPIPIPPPVTNRVRAVFVTFPTDKIYFPLIPTSVYESKRVPATIRVLGFVSPNIFKDIKPFTEVSYFQDKSAHLDKNFSRKVKSTDYYQKAEYTKIEINAPSKLLTEDLWIRMYPPVKPMLSKLLVSTPFVLFLVLLTSLSVLSGIASGAVIFGKSIPLKKFALVGLANCFSLLGLVAGLVVLGTKEAEGSVLDVMKSLKSKGYIWKCRLATLIAILDYPFVILITLYIFFGGVFYLISPHYGIYEGILGGASIPVIFLFPYALLFLVKHLRHVNSEDKELFEKLKRAGYSTWTISPADPRKYFFVPVFSAFFIVSVLLFGFFIKLFI